ncbi:MAG: hypothetical protein RIC56_17780 [Pseudomonadales bacterium]
MRLIRERVKEHLPSVLLTLLSIVQALALELLWSHVRETGYLYESWSAALWWSQILAVFLGIVLIWVVYASSAMRFRWVPSTGDSVYPFIIGISEFVLVATLGPDHLGVWFLTLAFVFAIMNWVSHETMRRARFDEENAEFFAGVGRATLRDFYGAFAVVAGLAAFGIGAMLWEPGTLVAAVSIVIANGLLIAQLYVARRFWERSIAP